MVGPYSVRYRNPADGKWTLMEEGFSSYAEAEKAAHAAAPDGAWLVEKGVN